MLRRLVAIAVLMLGTSWAQSDQKPRFPLPPVLSELSAVKVLGPELRTAIAPAIAASACKPNGSETYGTAEVSLRDTHVTLVRIIEPCLCGASGNCPIYGVHENKLVLPDGSGFAYAIVKDPKHGTPELVIASHTSQKVTALQRYRWKGSHLKLQDCEATVPKEDAKSAAWDPEELNVTTCDAIATE